MKTAIYSGILLGLCISLPFGCAHDEGQNAPQAAVGQTYESAGNTGSDVTEVSVAGALRDACEMHDVQSFFAFDSVKLHDTSGMLSTLANCLSSGALKGRNIRIVGHADSIGTDKYNKDLSKSRADTVAMYLEQNGVAKDKVITHADGREYAVGKDDEGRKVDRRVDIQLAD